MTPCTSRWDAPRRSLFNKYTKFEACVISYISTVCSVKKSAVLPHRHGIIFLWPICHSLFKTLSFCSHKQKRHWWSIWTPRTRNFLGRVRWLDQEPVMNTSVLTLRNMAWFKLRFHSRYARFNWLTPPNTITNCPETSLYFSLTFVLTLTTLILEISFRS